MARNEQEILRMAYRQLMTSSTKRFTEKMFPHMHKTPFIFGKHHDLICEYLDKVFAGEIVKLIINIAPRYGKTELVSKQFIAYGFAINPASKFIHLSYSGSLTMENSMEIKDIISSPLFQHLFSARVRPGRDTKAKWDTIQGGGLYATSTLGQITGFGAGATDAEDGEVNESALDEYSAIFNPNKFTGAIVIDDPIRPEDALSDVVREQVNRRFETTIRNRVNSRRTPIIIVCQRTHENDLCGYLMNLEPDEWTVLSIPAISIDENGNEQALWPHKHTLEELHKIEAANPFVFDTQYMQDPTPIEGLMYASFKTYQTLPVGDHIIKNYTDTADTGSDRLCSIDYAEFTTGECYVLDILYTDKPMEYTEPETARMMNKDNVSIANIESNNGGRGFARNVERNLRLMGNDKTVIQWFTQTKNKQSRIFTHSAAVQNTVYFPEDWKTRWPAYYNAMKSYRKEGRNKHDDAPDATTGLIEKKFSAGRSRWSRT